MATLMTARGARVLTPGAAATAVGLKFCANITVAGNVSITFRDSTTLVMTLATGYFDFDYEVIQVNTGGTTATGTYYNLVGS